MWPTQEQSFTHTDRIPPPIPCFGVKFPLCVFPQGENFTLLGDNSYTKLVVDRQEQFNNCNQFNYESDR